MHTTTERLVRIHILGPVDAEVAGDGNGRLPAQLRKILAILTVARGVPLSAEQIARRLWGDEPPGSAGHMVRAQVRTLRRLFASSGRDIVAREHAGYRLDQLGLEIDAERFRALVQAGRMLRAAGRTAEAVSTLERGLGLWRGAEALADVVEVPDLRAAAAELEELRFLAEELVAGGYIALGHPEQALPILRTMTVLYPSRELAWLQLMAAQTLTGRRIEASSETYRRARYHLVEATGLDAPLLAQVHVALLRGVPGQDLVTMISTLRG